MTRNYRFTIPPEIRVSAGIKMGDILTWEYDRVKNQIMIKLPRENLSHSSASISRVL
ncbi:MAG: AbrB/MazE/SpoVT family DNA-binding domain-containing protein [Candidatus Bathyarchaeota archaeon]|nr:AbrB/MazE/SpoVT family DNA-binding domain-containing protein [Candidatus Bathyarchaeota archaeon]